MYWRIEDNLLLRSLSSPVIVYRFDSPHFLIEDMNQASEILEQVVKTEVIGKPVELVFPGVFEFGFLAALKRVLETDRAEHIETRYYVDNRIHGWRENDLIPMRDGIIVAVYKEQTERKDIEKALLRAGYYDSLTQLCSRAFFEVECQRIDVVRQLPISLILADINGLKFVNDSFGHLAGDQLLVRFSQILKDAVRQEDIVARWGGDEFVILLPKTTVERAQEVADALLKSVAAAKADPVPLSASFGVAAKSASGQSLNDVLREAEDMMYSNKLLDKKSFRSSIVFSLTHALQELTSETQFHSDRVICIVSEFGKRLRLMPQEIEELRLLTALHDIGMLGVPKEIINKPLKLHPDEWIEVKKHCEIGYRIAEATPEISHISKYILCVHERWDGKGYPQGIDGNAIPKLSRIISIVAAFDAMVSSRPYRAAMSQQEAIAELTSGSGSQFDPYLVSEFIYMMENNMFKKADCWKKTL